MWLKTVCGGWKLSETQKNLKNLLLSKNPHFTQLLIIHQLNYYIRVFHTNLKWLKTVWVALGVRTVNGTVKHLNYEDWSHCTLSLPEPSGKVNIPGKVQSEDYTIMYLLFSFADGPRWLSMGVDTRLAGSCLMWDIPQTSPTIWVAKTQEFHRNIAENYCQQLSSIPLESLKLDSHDAIWADTERSKELQHHSHVWETHDRQVPLSSCSISVHWWKCNADSVRVSYFSMFFTDSS